VMCLVSVRECPVRVSSQELNDLADSSRAFPTSVLSALTDSTHVSLSSNSASLIGYRDRVVHMGPKIVHNFYFTTIALCGNRNKYMKQTKHYFLTVNMPSDITTLF
jgi:hypothetical protein